MHMDGARFANALARINVSPAQATWKAGVDVLSLGATKGGALAAEAVVFFDPARAAHMGERRKRGGQLISKHRFIAAQFEAFFSRRSVAQACAPRQRAGRPARRAPHRRGFRPGMAGGGERGVRAPAARIDERLTGAGASYYPWETDGLPDGVTVGPTRVLVRLVTSFATSDAEIARFADIVAASAADLKFLHHPR